MVVYLRRSGSISRSEAETNLDSFFVFTRNKLTIDCRFHNFVEDVFAENFFRGIHNGHIIINESIFAKQPEEQRRAKEFSCRF